jgi:putative ABC transport system permease protein
MRHLRRLLARIVALVGSRRADRELDREVDSHLLLLQDKFVEEGLSLDEARSAARRAYGSVESAKELQRDERSFPLIEQTLRDARFAVRTLLRNPGFTTVAVLTLALGIAANAAIFSIINTVLLHPLPYPNPERLVAVRSSDIPGGFPILSFTKFQHLQKDMKSFEWIGALVPATASLSTGGIPEQVPAARVSADFFRALGADPVMGRNFLPEEDREGGADVVIVSSAFWRDHLGGAADAIGRVITLDGKPTRVVGIAPEWLRFSLFQPQANVWFPRVFDNVGLSPDRVRSGASYLFVAGRLKADASAGAAEAESQASNARYKAAYPGFADATHGLTMTPLDTQLVGNLRSPLIAVLLAVGFVLLIACVNVASLLMARSSARTKEIAVRRALGATRARVVWQLLTESMVLSAAGGAIGIALAWIALPVVVRLAPPGTLPFAEQIRMDGTVLAFCAAISCLTGIAFGLVPSLAASKDKSQAQLREGGRGNSGGPRGNRLRQAMVVAEVALALMLLTGAGLLLRSLVNLMNVKKGFEAENVTTFAMSLPLSHYPEAAHRLEFYRRMLERVQSLPGVESASIVSHLPMSGGVRWVYFCPEGRACLGIGKDPVTAWRQISPDFFATMRIPLVRGRVFTEQDSASGPNIVIVNQTFAMKHFGTIEALGKRLYLSRDKKWAEIVGVVGDTKFTTLSAEGAEEMYVPYTRDAFPQMTLAVRSTGPVQPMVAGVRQKVFELDRDLALAQIQSMGTYVAATIAQPRLVAQLVGAFAGFALLLAAIGIYGVMAYSVSQTSQEIAIRMALGAHRASIFQMIVGRGMRLVGVGILMGITASVALTRLMAALLFGTGAIDGLTLAASAMLFVIVALAACYVPSRRATRVETASVLRAQ